jgi:hypothetical protein
VAHSFLLLSLLFLAPGLVVFLARRDLRPVIGLMALCSIPFAFTERFFYPDYWEPRFLFDLGRRIGFGLEDLLFVVGLAAFTSTAHAFFTGARYEPLGEETPRRIALRCIALLGVALLLTGAVALARVPMIYGSCGIMLGIGAAIVLARRDLALPALSGGALSLAVYTGICLVFGAILPGIFDQAWHTERFIGRFLLGVPVEELMYGFASGLVATIFYPYVTGRRFRRGE